jgi:AraC-like DNA-binding protein
MEQSYRERRPVPALAGLVSSAWVQQVSPGARPYMHRNVPNGCVEVRCRLGRVPELVGPLTRPLTETLAPGSTVVGLRFRPGTASGLPGIPAPELADLVLDAEHVWGRAAVAIGERLASCEPAVAVASLQDAVAGRLAAPDGPDPMVAQAIRLMRTQAGDVAPVREALWMSERQFRRRCLAAVGVPPKPLHRMLRFQGLLARIQFAVSRGGSRLSEGRPGDGLAQLAVDCGYADQAHLSRECVRLTGVTPGVFLRETEQSCGCGHDHAASFGPWMAGLFNSGARVRP